MNHEEYKTRSGKTQRRPVMTEPEYRAYHNDNAGFCLSCGAEADGVEPDARRYPCEVCEQPKVYGLEELMMLGLVKLTTGRKGASA